MNRISAIAILATASLATCAGAIAQQPGLTANIPFDFTVGNTRMPAGHYTISRPSQQFLELKIGNHIASVVSSQSNEELNPGSELVFDRYGDQYFLRKVLCPKVSSLNLEIAASKEERRARERAIEAKLPSSGEQTLVAAR
jgi:hypothetical protein